MLLCYRRGFLVGRMNLDSLMKGDFWKFKHVLICQQRNRGKIYTQRAFVCYVFLLLCYQLIFQEERSANSEVDKVMITSTLGICHLFGFLNSVPGLQSIVSHNRSSLSFTGSFWDCLILSFFSCAQLISIYTDIYTLGRLLVGHCFI